MDISNIIVTLITIGAVIYSIINTIETIRSPKSVQPLLYEGERQSQDELLFEELVTPLVQSSKSIEKKVNVAQAATQPAESVHVVEHTRDPALNAILKKLSSKKMLWVAHEIVSPPLSLRPPSRQAGYLEDHRNR